MDRSEGKSESQLQGITLDINGTLADIRMKTFNMEGEKDMNETKKDEIQNNGPAARKKAPWLRPVLLLGFVTGVLVTAKLLGLDQRFDEVRVWILSLGPWGPVVFVFLYIGAVVAAIPGSAITVAAGVLFGSVKGVALVSVASTIGATLAFLISRYFARRAVVEWLSGNEKFHRLDKLTEEHGAIIVALTRLVPLFPFNLLNYGFGLTRVRLWTYVFWSWLCMLPGTILYVAGTDAVLKVWQEGKVPWTLLGIFFATGAILFLLVKKAKERLQKDKQSG
jgi:uncharacterized membrane protein YdjX (TVP38/TMEM64 family)